MTVKYIPNILSVSRIVLSVFLLFLFKNKAMFLLVYCIAGVTDVLDGIIARRYKVQTLSGARLDSVGDFFFFVILVAYLFFEYRTIMFSYVYFIGVIFLLRLLNVLAGFVKHGRFIMIHTIANKVAGLLVFLLPIVLIFKQQLLLYIVIIVALLASVEELLIILLSPKGKIDLNKRSVFLLRSHLL